MEHDHYHGAHSPSEATIENQLSLVVGANLFDEQPLCLNSFFRFQLGSNTFDGESPRACRVCWLRAPLWPAACSRFGAATERCAWLPRRVLADARSGLASIGYEFAMEAWKRVASVGATIVSTGTAHGDKRSLESLRLQKDAVKRELKLFDVHFAKFYGRQPSRLDKECLRKLYEFHKQLKAYIASEEVKLERRHSHAALVESKTLINSHNLPPAVSGGGGPGAQSVTPKQVPLDQLQAMDVKVLKAEKRALKIKLRRFEDEFIRQNGQKPQSYQEVGIIREDYSRYKFLKEQLQAVEQAAGGGTWGQRPSISP